MDATELDSVRRSGIVARQSGLSYFDNPHHFISAPVDATEQGRDLEGLCNALSAGWLIENAGRDEAIKALMRVKYWYATGASVV